VPDEHGIAIAIENLVQGDGIDDQPLGVGAVGEAVEAQRQRAGPGLQQANVKLVRQHHADSSQPWRGARGSHDVPLLVRVWRHQYRMGRRSPAITPVGGRSGGIFRAAQLVP
jgi:hypothetical protein